MRANRGRLSAVFDGNGAFLREIAIDGEELFRGLGFVARDANWGTPTLAADLSAKQDGEVLRVRSSGALEGPSEDLAWNIAWEVAETAIEAEATWSSKRGYTTNRTGFVILHSLGASRGRYVQVTHPDGTLETSNFPALVSPHQPFFDIASMSYESANGTSILIKFEGETFEIEDQRNWTDASYKTYCRPLRLPFPYRIEPGVSHSQRLRISLAPASPFRSRAAPTDSQPLLGPPIAPPLIGTSLPLGPATPDVADAVRRLGLDFVALELDPASASFVHDVDSALAAIEGPVRFDLLPAAREARLRAVAVASERAGARSCLGFTLWGADDAEIGAARSLAPTQKFGAGSATFFAELNRAQPLPALAEYLSFPCTPTVHGASDDTIGETTEPIEDLLATLEAKAPLRALHVGPLTLGVRYNPNATTPEGRKGAPADPRQSSPIAAAWALGTIAALFGASVRAIGVFEPMGPNGLVTRSGAMTPTADVLNWIRSGGLHPLRKVSWRNSPRARGLFLNREGDSRLWVAHSHKGSAKLTLPPGDWRIEASHGSGELGFEGESLVVEDFAVVALSAAK